MAAENPVVFAEIGNPKRVIQLTENTSTTNAYFLTEKAGEPEAKKTAYATVESAVKAKIQGEYVKALSETPSETKTMSEKLEVAEFKKRDDAIKAKANQADLNASNAKIVQLEQDSIKNSRSAENWLQDKTNGVFQLRRGGLFSEESNLSFNERGNFAGNTNIVRFKINTRIRELDYFNIGVRYYSEGGAVYFDYLTFYNSAGTEIQQKPTVSTKTIKINEDSKWCAKIEGVPTDAVELRLQVRAHQTTAFELKEFFLSDASFENKTKNNTVTVKEVTVASLAVSSFKVSGAESYTIDTTDKNNLKGTITTPANGELKGNFRFRFENNNLSNFLSLKITSTKKIFGRATIYFYGDLDATKYLTETTYAICGNVLCLDTPCPNGAATFSLVFAAKTEGDTQSALTISDIRTALIPHSTLSDSYVISEKQVVGSDDKIKDEFLPISTTLKKGVVSPDGLSMIINNGILTAKNTSQPINLVRWGDLSYILHTGWQAAQLKVNDNGYLTTAGTTGVLFPLKKYMLEGKTLFFKILVRTSGDVFFEYNNWVNSANSSVSAAINPTNTTYKDNFVWKTYKLDSLPVGAEFFRVQFRPATGANYEIAEFYVGYEDSVERSSQSWMFEKPKKVRDFTDSDFFRISNSTDGISYTKESRTLSVNIAGATTKKQIEFSVPLKETTNNHISGICSALEGNNVKQFVIEIYFYNVVNGIYGNRGNSRFLCRTNGGRFCVPITDKASDANTFRIFITPSGGDETLKATISNIAITQGECNLNDVLYTQSESEIAIAESNSYTDRKIAEIDGGGIMQYNTLQDAISANASGLFNVGDKLWRKKKSGTVDPLKECNDHKYYHTGHREVKVRSLRNIKVVDTKGYLRDAYNRGRYCTHITSDGLMVFKTEYGKCDIIHFDNFIKNLIPHDGSGTDASRINWVDAPQDQTAEYKQQRLAQELPNWLMYDESKSNLFTRISNIDGAFSEQTIEFEDGTLFNPSWSKANLINRKDNSITQGRLSNPISCNPISLIVSQAGNKLHDIVLKDHAPHLRWGIMSANSGSILADNIYACIDFTNGKEITVPISLIAGSYDISIRGRRYGNNRVDGIIELYANNVKIGEISTAGSNLTCGEITDMATFITLASACTEITLKNVCDALLPLKIGNGASSSPRWGKSAFGKYGTFTEYEASPKRNGMVYFTKDCGKTWEAIFDVSLNGLTDNDGGGHVHGATIDIYWKKIIVLCGDSEHTKGIYYADFDDNTDINNIVWKRDAGEQPFYGTGSREQYCSAYALPNCVMFGTDCGPTGIFRMNRIDSDTFTRREPSLLFGSGSISHIPTMFNQKDDTKPVLIWSMQGDVPHPIWRYNTALLHATYDGIHITELFKDVARIAGFGSNNSMNVYHYKDKIILNFFTDGRFENGHTMIIADWQE